MGLKPVAVNKKPAGPAKPAKMKNSLAKTSTKPSDSPANRAKRSQRKSMGLTGVRPATVKSKPVAFGRKTSSRMPKTGMK